MNSPDKYTRHAGYQMINSVHLRNFRGFADAKLDNCRRVNIILGENGAGKTALLEALFLACGNSPEVAVRLKNLRGLGAPRLQGSPAQIDDAMWLDLFHKFNRNKNIFIELRGDSENARSLAVSYNAVGNVVLPLSIGTPKGDELPHSSLAPILFKWKGPGNAEHSSRPSIKNGSIELPLGPTLPVESFFFAANHTYSSEETANRFSALSKKYKETEIVDLFKKHFPIVDGLSVEVTAGAAMVYAATSTLPEKVPINLVSSGMSKMAAILFAIPSQKKGVVLIDEIENGLYYRRLPLVWRSIHAFCKKYDAQVFASTHSAECLSAAAGVAAEHPDDFSVIQVQSNADGAKLKQFSGARFTEAVNADIEIR